MKDRKILFVDLDGTLLTDSKEITQENLAAIRKATEQGHAVVVTTGRPLYSTERLLGKLGLTSPGCYAITSNGAMIYDSGEKKVLFQTGVSRDCLREAFDEAFKAGIHPQTYSDTGVLCEKDCPEVQYYAKSNVITYRVVEDVAKELDFDPIKILFVSLNDRQKLERFRQHMEPWSEAHHIDMFFSCDEYLEFLPEGINKGSGIRWLCNYLNVPLDHTYAAGDAENDITMLQAVKHPCVMKNARPEMYAYGTYITEHDNNHSGIAEIIEKFMLA
ncbi:HAD family phosphatase [Anaerosacchariphilus sp. NSJ-68]|uniref:HAD family phosphatase n=2 Tax=Lachnospiraceae TaxID=186803 RepID=A0A923RLV3_9FIRM|nr:MULTISPECIES: Cof-type HAD-IIB family hydrolase [Lachnospiraceae]MBC5659633.1 HAD family phosphatase [Anaerosacchariphilus hominis]MBC5697300.1 HAD family phosphatase [Roseburia difficilis]